MARPRLPVHKIREILRLKNECGLSERQIAVACRISRGSVANYLARASECGLCWPLPVDLTDEQLDDRLFRANAARVLPAYPVPDWRVIHLELRRKGVTLRLLWEEYMGRHPAGYSYSRFCELYAAWKAPLSARMRQPHMAGDKMFVDWSGLKVAVVDAATGEEQEAEIFVAVLGASNYTYVEATWSQSLPDWVGAHTRAFAFFGGVPRVVVPDNLKSGVTKPDFYEPELNQTYAEMARHYGVAIVPTRTRKPRDKAKVEKGVQDVQRRVLAPLRHRRFFSLDELNLAISVLLEQYNNRRMQLVEGSRRMLFEELDRPKLKPLPVQPYTYAEWKKATPGPDYHVRVNAHHYSVPYELIRRRIDVRMTASTIECFHKGHRVAAHRRSYKKGGYTTVAAHMPERHRRYAEWNPERLISWATKTGPATATVVRTIMAERPHPEQGFRACLGIMRLAKSYGDQRTEAACYRALSIGTVRYRSVESILKNGLDQLELPEYGPESNPIIHTNIRGPRYYD